MTLDTAATATPAGSGNESGATAAGQATGTTAPAASQGAAPATTTATPAAPPAVPGLESLDTDYPNLDPASKAALTKILTPKFMKAAELTRAAEEKAARLGDLARLVEMSQAGKGKEVLRTLAAASGLSITFGDEGDGAAAPKMDPVSQQMYDALSEALSPETAAKLVPILRQSAEQSVAPLQQQAALNAAQAKIDSYFAANPEKAKYKSKIEELSKTIHPAPGSSTTIEGWLDNLHLIASAGDAEAKGAAAALAQIQGSAAAAGGGAAGGAGARDTDVAAASGSDEGKSIAQLIKEAAVSLVRR